jgi:hypothetical protein
VARSARRSPPPAGPAPRPPIRPARRRCPCHPGSCRRRDRPRAGGRHPSPATTRPACRPEVVDQPGVFSVFS